MGERMSKTCECNSVKRRLAIVVNGASEDALELWSAAEKMQIPYDAHAGIAVFPLGPDTHFCSIADLADFLRGIAPSIFHRLHADWLPHDAKELPAVPLALSPLADMAPLPSSSLPRLIEQRAFETWFQPILRADGLAPWGYECLMRAQREDGSSISPEEVIAWARQEHMLFMLDRLCRELHVEHAAAAGAPPGTVFFINFLPTVIYDPEVCLRTTIHTAEKAGLSPEQMVFEVVETENVPDRVHLRRILDHYREHGFRIALDDLGAGHNDLVLLGQLDPDFIKIERELIRQSATSKIHRAICRSIVDIGHGSGRMVLAEGVETEGEWKVARNLGVDLVQGFLFGRPQPGIPT